jgi:hypothetical protein
MTYSEKDALDTITGYVQFATTIALGSLGFALTVPSVFTGLFHGHSWLLLAARYLLIFSWLCFVFSLYHGIRAWGTIAGMMISKVGRASDKTLAGRGFFEVVSLLIGVVALAISFLIANFVPEPFAVPTASEAIGRALRSTSIPANAVTSVSSTLVSSADSHEPTWQIVIGYHTRKANLQENKTSEVFIDAANGSVSCLPAVGSQCALPSAHTSSQNPR